MKKYLSGIIAIVIAIGLSAFTNAPRKNISKSQDGLYWYTLDGIFLDELQNEDPLTKGDAMSGPDAITSCPDDTDADPCLVGTESPDDHGLPYGTPGPTELIKDVDEP